MRTPPALSYHELQNALTTDEMAIEQELLKEPVLLQIASDECCQLGLEWDNLKVDLKALELDEKTAEAIVLLHAKDPANGKKTVDEAKAMVDSHADIIAVRRSIIDTQRRLAVAKNEYDKWYNLYENHKAKLRSLSAYKDMITTGYVGYKHA